MTKTKRIYLTFFYFLFLNLTSGCTFLLKTSLQDSLTDSTASPTVETPSVPSVPEPPFKVVVKNAPNGVALKPIEDLVITTNLDVDLMYLTNTAGCGSGGIWEYLTPIRYNWNFKTPETTGKVYLYAKYKKTDGLESECFTYEFDFTNDLYLTVSSPVPNERVQGYRVFHGTCKAGSMISIESPDLTYFPSPVPCTGQFHIGVTLSGGSQGNKSIKVVATDNEGIRTSLLMDLDYQNDGINSGLGFDAFTTDIKIDSGLDKLYVLGPYDNFNGIPTGNLVRLNMDGTRDNSFTSLGFGVNSWPYALDIEPSTHKIYVGGDFSSYGGGGVSKIVRLNPDGSRDISFTPVAPNNDVVSVAFDSVNSKIYIGGYFTNYAGSGANRIVRLNYNGSLDATFNVGTGFDSDVNRIQIDPVTNKIYVMGSMNYYKSTQWVPGLARLNLDGSIDTTFRPGLDGSNPVNAAISLTSTNSAWIGTSLSSYSSGTNANIASFDLITGAKKTPWNATYNADGEVLDLVSGPSESFVLSIGNAWGIGSWNNQVYETRDIMKVSPNGFPFPEFKTGMGAHNEMGWLGRMAVDYARKIIFIVGDISRYNYTTRNGLIAISLDDASLK